MTDQANERVRIHSRTEGETEGSMESTVVPNNGTNAYQTLEEGGDPTQLLIEEQKPQKREGRVKWWLIGLGLALGAVGIIIGITYLYNRQNPIAGEDTVAYAHKWRDRTIYFLLTDRFACDPNTPGSACTDCTNLRSYCGGNFDAIRGQLGYITEMGFDAIWISPIPDNSDDPQSGPGYHGYYARNLSKVNPHFGDETGLKALIDEAHERGVLVMLDAVANHAGPSTVEPLDTFDPFNDAVLHYHPQCDLQDQMGQWASPGDYTYAGYNQTDFEKCWLFGGPGSTAGLPDLNTESTFVREKLYNWVHNTVTNFGFDGMRIDTTPYVPKPFWKNFTKAAGVFSMGEITSPNHTYTADYQRDGSMTSLLGYPSYFYYKSVFLGTAPRASMTTLAESYRRDQTNFSNPYVVGLFIDNHDNSRALWLTDGDKSLVLNALTYIWFYPGIPIFYYGTEQGLDGHDDTFSDIWGNCASKGGSDPCNRQALWPFGYNRNAPIYQFIKKLNLFRKQSQITKYPLVQISASDTHYVYVRGPALVLTTNVGNATSTQSFIINLTPAHNCGPYEQGNQGQNQPSNVQWLDTQLVNLLDQTDKITVPHNGIVTVQLQNGQPKIYYPSHSYNPGDNDDQNNNDQK